MNVKTNFVSIMAHATTLLTITPALAHKVSVEITAKRTSTSVICYHAPTTGPARISPEDTDASVNLVTMGPFAILTSMIVSYPLVRMEVLAETVSITTSVSVFWDIRGITVKTILMTAQEILVRTEANASTVLAAINAFVQRALLVVIVRLTSTNV